MRIPLRHLEALYWVSRLGSFTAAAGRLHSTQSAISMRIRDLEETLAQELFDRTARSARLTAKGHELVGYAERVMGLMEEWSSQELVDSDGEHALLERGSPCPLDGTLAEYGRPTSSSRRIGSNTGSR